LEAYTPADITEWTDTSEPEARQTALCPKCGIDAVIGSEAGYPITKDFLSGMKSYWF
jgi:acetone carboxylase gamma subunit